jgi:hypothetical protein
MFHLGFMFLLRLEYADATDSSPGAKNIDLFPGTCIIPVFRIPGSS